MDARVLKSIKRIALCLVVALFCQPSFAEIVVKVKKAGTLSSLISPEQLDTCTRLTVYGKLNSADLRVLRRMGGSKGEGKLKILNLYHASFCSDDNPYVVLDMEKEHFHGISSPVFDDKAVGSYTIPTQGGLGSTTYSNVNHIAYYKPYYSLGGRPESPDYEATFTHIWVKRLLVDFSKEHTASDHTRLISYNMLSFRGHRIELENDCYKWYAYLRKGYFCADMFYGCPNLQAVILPKNIRTIDQLTIYDDRIQYYDVVKNGKKQAKTRK